MYCKKCGEKNWDGAEYCKKCGQRLKRNKRHSKMYRVVVVLMVIIIAGILSTVPKIYKAQNESNNMQLAENLYCTLPEKNRIEVDTASGKRYVKDELVFEARDEFDFVDIERWIFELDAEITGYIEETNTYQIRFNKQLQYNELLNKERILKSSPYIKNLSLNTVYTCTSYANYPNDKEWLGEWSETPEGKNWGLEAIQAPEAWDALDDMRRMEAVKVGIFEVGGIEIEHEDLKDSFMGKSGINMAKDTAHGTQVAGIIGAGYNNDIGITGVVPKVSLDMISYEKTKKYLQNSDYEDISIMVIKVACSYLIAVCKDRVINVSMGFDTLQFSASRGNENAQSELKELNDSIGEFLSILINNKHDFLICKAAGNGNEKYNKNRIYEYLRADKNDENAPYGYIPADDTKSIKKYKSYKDLEERIEYGDVDAQYDIFSGITQKEVRDRIIVVGSVSQGINSKITGFSNCGKRLDVVAPGDDIYSTTAGNGYMKEGGWGTSYSAPYVAGIAALVYAVNPDLSDECVKRIIKESASGEYWGYLEGNAYKYGMANAQSAVKAAAETIKNIEEKTDESTLATGRYSYSSGERLSVLDVSEEVDGKRQCELMFWYQHGESSSAEDFFFEWEAGKEEYIVLANRANKEAKITLICKGDVVDIRVVIPGYEFSWDGSGDWVNQEYLKSDNQKVTM